MSKSIANRLNDVHPQMLRAHSEADPQRLGKREVGMAIETALDRCRITKQEAAFAMGYSDSGVMGRWIAGTETPQFAKLWMLGTEFQKHLVAALAEQIDDSGVVLTMNVGLRFKKVG